MNTTIIINRLRSYFLNPHAGLARISFFEPIRVSKAKNFEVLINPLAELGGRLACGALRVEHDFKILRFAPGFENRKSELFLHAGEFHGFQEVFVGFCGGDFFGQELHGFNGVER